MVAFGFCSNKQTCSRNRMTQLSIPCLWYTEKTEIFNELKNKSEKLSAMTTDQCQEAKSRRHNEKNPGSDSIKGSTQTAGKKKQQKREGESQISHFWSWGDASWATASTVIHPQGIPLGSNHIQWSSRQGNQWTKSFLHLQVDVSGWISISTVQGARWRLIPPLGTCRCASQARWSCCLTVNFFWLSYVLLLIWEKFKGLFQMEVLRKGIDQKIWNPFRTLCHYPQRAQLC